MVFLCFFLVFYRFNCFFSLLRLSMFFSGFSLGFLLFLFWGIGRGTCLDEYPKYY